MDSALDSTNPQNPHKKIKWMVALFGELKLVRVKRTLLLAKAKSSKSFLDSALWNRGWILWFCRIEGDFAFFACEILRNCGI